MTMKRLFLAAAVLAAWAVPAGACLAGWDCCKWNDQDHQTPKYVVGRIIAAFPHTPAGLKQALPVINAVYPGTEILPGKGDKVRIPCVGVVDLIVAAGEGGKAWWWGADSAGNECGKCRPNRCEEVSKTKKCGGGSGGAGVAAGTGAGVGGAGSGFGGSAANCGGVKVPDRKSVVVQTANDHPDEWSAKLNPKEDECRADSRYLDLVVDNLRREDRRWGFNCKRGDCNNPSHDVVAYYFGQGEPYEGAPQVMLVDMIMSTCAPDARPGWLPLEFGEGAGWTSKGRFASGPRQNVTVNCPKGGAAAASSVAPLGGGGGGGGSAPSSSPSSAPRSAAKKSDGIVGGRNEGGAPRAEGPGAAAEPQEQEPAPAAPEEAEEEPQ